jgi:predicted lipoprotein
MDQIIRKHLMKNLLLALVLVTILNLTACKAFFTVVPINEEKSLEEGGSNTNKGFDKVAYVDKIWDSKVLPTAKDKAVPFDTLYTALKLNQDEASQKYGNKVGGPYNFLTSLDAKITKVNTTSRAGTIEATTQAAGNDVSLIIQIGPVIRGTSIRDAVGFIAFNEFVNQLQFADVADELNTRAYNLSLKDKKFDDTLVGKTVTVTGAFTLDSGLDKLTVTPIFFEIK